MSQAEYDVLIVGGSHAGLSAAMAIGRMRRSGLVVDAGKPRNEISEHANNIAGLGGINPNQWRAQARDNLQKYGSIEFIHNRVAKIEKNSSSFTAFLESGEDRRFSKSHSGVRRKGSTARDRGAPGPLGQGCFPLPLLPRIRGPGSKAGCNRQRRLYRTHAPNDPQPVGRPGDLHSGQSYSPRSVCRRRHYDHAAFGDGCRIDRSGGWQRGCPGTGERELLNIDERRLTAGTRTLQAQRSYAPQGLAAHSLLNFCLPATQSDGAGPSGLALKMWSACLPQSDLRIPSGNAGGDGGSRTRVLRCETRISTCLVDYQFSDALTSRRDGPRFASCKRQLIRSPRQINSPTEV